jgi:glycosyltransferase involved in cell wall biosynthesis
MSRRVLIVCGGGLVSGKELMSLALGRGLRHDGWDVEYAASRWGNAEFLERLHADDFRYSLLRLGFLSASLKWKPIIWTLDQLRYWPSLFWGYRQLICRKNPDLVVHTNWHHALLLAPLLDSSRDIYWSHELLPLSHHYEYIFRAIARRVARIICVSHAAARSFELNGVDSERIVVVHNGSTATNISSPSVSPPLRLGIVGQIAPWKGHADAIQALSLVGSAGADATLRIFGSGSEQFMRELQEKAHKLGVANRIEWCGFIKNASEIYSSIDVCLVPSRFPDPLPTSAIEASLHGRPVIATSIGGLPEIVKDGETGLLVPPGRPDLLAQAIDRFLKSSHAVRSMGRSARLRAEIEFSYEQFIRRFVCAVEEARSPLRDVPAK